MALDSFAVAPQPPPTAGEGDAVWPTIYSNENLAIPEWLAADMRARHDAGVAKYGTPLRVWNGRNVVVDAYQESLDLLVYAQQARARLGAFSLQERGRGVPSTTLSARLTLDVIFHQALQAARWLGELARIDSVPSQPPKVTR